MTFFSLFFLDGVPDLIWLNRHSGLWWPRWLPHWISRKRRMSLVILWSPMSFSRMRSLGWFRLVRCFIFLWAACWMTLSPSFCYCRLNVARIGHHPRLIAISDLDPSKHSRSSDKPPTLTNPTSPLSRLVSYRLCYLESLPLSNLQAFEF